MRSHLLHRIQNRIQGLLQVTMISNRLIRVPPPLTRRPIRHTIPTTHTTRHEHLDRITSSNRQTQQTPTSRRTPIRHNRFLDLISSRVPMYPLTINHNALYSRLTTLTIRLISRRLQKSSTQPRACQIRNILHRLLLLNTLHILNNSLHHSLKIKPRGLRNLIRRQRIQLHRQNTLKTNRHNSTVIIGPQHRHTGARQVKPRIISRPHTIRQRPHRIRHSPRLIIRTGIHRHLIRLIIKQHVIRLLNMAIPGHRRRNPRRNLPHLIIQLTHTLHLISNHPSVNIRRTSHRTIRIRNKRILQGPFTRHSNINRSLHRTAITLRLNNRQDIHHNHLSTQSRINSNTTSSTHLTRQKRRLISMIRRHHTQTSSRRTKTLRLTPIHMRRMYNTIRHSHNLTNTKPTLRRRDPIRV